MRSKKVPHVVCVVLIACILVFSIAPISVSASIIPFGGRTQSVTTCTCMGGCFKLQIGQPKGGTFMFCYGSSKLYSNYNIYQPAWQLGTAVGYLSCMVIEGNYCRSDGGGPFIIQDGTSLY